MLTALIGALPKLVEYGSNFLFYNGLGKELQGYANEARDLLRSVEEIVWIN
jgi:hypothetical protein